MTEPQKVTLNTLIELPGKRFTGFDTEAEAVQRAVKNGQPFFYHYPKNGTYYVPNPVTE
jgi:hypothetical protein